MEALLGVTVIGEVFIQMQNGEAYLNFQESQTHINELIIYYSFIAIQGLSFTFAKFNIRMESLNTPNLKIVFFRGLGRAINEDEFCEILMERSR
jgi:hypothetical protein